MRKVVSCLLAGVCALSIMGLGPIARAENRDAQDIFALEESYAAAVNARDVDAIMKIYIHGPELLVYDVGTPRQFMGFDAYKKDWQDTLALMQNNLKMDIDDVSVTADGKLAWSHSIQHITWTGADGKPGELTVRVTDCFRKINGTWLIVLEHVSVPIDLTTGKPDMTSKM